MSTIQKAKQQVLTDLKSAIGKEYTPTMEELSYPPDAKMGDLSFACFALAKGLKTNPAQLATELAAKIAPAGFVKSASAIGPYVNFTFDHHALSEAVLQEVSEKKQAYGTSNTGGEKSVMVEYANLNTHKDVHIGHLRNLLVGQAAVELYRANGYCVIPVTYINDLGAHVASCVWAVQNVGGGKPAEGEDPITFLQRMYVEAVKQAGENPTVKEEISQVQRDLEAGKGPLRSLWKTTHRWSTAYLKMVYKEFKLPLETWYFESDFIKKTKQAIEELIKKGIVISSQGAWIVDLEAEGLGANLLVKTDGTLLYNAKDIALALQKEEDYHPQRSVYVIDARQSLVMKQLFATLKRMGFTKELQHLSYEFVTLKEGAMSSRKGNIVRYEPFRDEVLNMARQETKKRHEDWSEKQVEKTARAVAFAAVRFGILKQDLDKKIVFDLQEAVSFEGFTGPYLLYSFARMKSLLRKAKTRKSTTTPVVSSGPAASEHQLLLMLGKYPEVVFSAGQSMRISSVAQYLFDLCKTFAEFYEQVPVLESEKDVRAARLALVTATAQVLQNGLGLLGVETVDEM